MFSLKEFCCIPNDVYFISTKIDDQPDFYFEIEANYYKNVAPKRKFEFIAGRKCARKALAHFGVPPCPIPIGTNREPIWPPGFVGSITHCEGFIAAAVAKSSDYLSLGIDAEQNRHIPTEIENMILTEPEMKFIQEQPSGETISLLIFSAKESIYKCTYPLVKQYIDFLDVDIVIEMAEKRILGKYPPYVTNKIGLKTIEGGYWRDKSHLLTAVFIKK